MRKLARLVAHKNMKKKGIVHANKKQAGESFFSENWRKYVK